jgi:L-lactate dehydrogenase complex protein LldG
MNTADHRKRFLQTIRTALGRTGQDPPSFDRCFPNQRAVRRAALVKTCRTRTRAERLDLLDILMARAAPLNIRVQPVEDAAAARAAVLALVQATAPEWGEHKQVATWSHPLVDALDLTSALAAVGVAHITPDTVAPAAVREAIRASYIGVTAADHCVADTATLAMTTRPGQPRAMSLVPSVHVAVIRLAQIVRDLEELYALLRENRGPEGEGLGRCTTLISGPSKTADIELTMVHGAHGPRALHMLVLTG